MTFAIQRLGRVTSTNDEAAARARAGAPHGTVVVAEEQTRGRGTKGRSWCSPPGGLYLSAILRLDLPPAAMPPLTLAAGVGVCDAARALGVAAGLKWPNDVVVARADGPRKLAGILVEAATRGDRVEYAIVGVGLNLDDAGAPAGPAATSIRAELGRAVPYEEVLEGVAGSLERAVARFVDEGAAQVVRAWKARSPLLGRVVRVREGGAEVAGVFADVDDEGALWLEAADGRRLRFVTGEVWV